MSKTVGTKENHVGGVGVDHRVLHKEAVVSSPIDRVWWAWTTSEGMASWWAKQSWIDLKIDGPFELYFLLDQPRGSQGSDVG